MTKFAEEQLGRQAREIIADLLAKFQSREENAVRIELYRNWPSYVPQAIWKAAVNEALGALREKPVQASGPQQGGLFDGE